MRLCACGGMWCLLPILVLLTVVRIKANQHRPRERHYYIAAVEIDWNYSNNGSGPTYKKVVFREYEENFRQAKTHPSWLGLLGPTLRAEVGETIVVTFRNMAEEAYSIHPHGVGYGKQSEGANYFDNTSQKEKEDDIVQKNGEHIYHWEVTSDVAPQADDPTCLTYTYISHKNVLEDYNSGLIGTLLICKPGSLDESGQQIGVHHEYVFLFGVFDENESKFKPSSYAQDNHIKHTINGYAKGSLPDISMCAYASVSLHLVGMSSKPEVFSVHMNGQVLQHNGHKVSSVGLISGATATTSMVAHHTGRWMLSSHNIKHMEAGMYGFVDVKNCDTFKAPRRTMSLAQKRQSKEWTYYIAAEEIIWDYAPNVPQYVDKDFKLQYLTQSPTRIGQKYKKAVYTLYNNASFTERLEREQRKNEHGILGPVIRAQIRDIIKIVFKNMASRPYSIYPHGLTIEKSEEGVNYPEGGNHSHAVQPGETHIYKWTVVEEDEPLEGDSRCLTRVYHSAVDTPRDIASGLIGPILICKSQSLNARNVQLKADKEQQAVFSVFDENKSWYLDDNIRHYCDRTKVRKDDLDFYNSNVMHTINGYVFESGPLLGFCNGEVATWHVSSIGAQDGIQTATFYGHPFEVHERTEDFLSLYPMTGETITMNMDNVGVWLLSSLNSHETTKGMRVKFRDVECYRDYQYEYEDETANDISQWNPQSWDEIQQKEKKKQEQLIKENPPVVDDYTYKLAQELGLRSLKNQSLESDVEELDLSFLSYDAIDVPDGDMDISINFTETKSNNETSVVKIKTTDDPLTSYWEEVDGINLTVVNLLNQSTDSTTHIQNRSAASSFKNCSMPKIGNITVSYGQNIKNDNITTNSSVSVVLSDLDGCAVSGTKNTTTYSTMALAIPGNESTEMTNLTVTLQQTTNLTVMLKENTNLTVVPVNLNLNNNQTSVGTVMKDSVENLTRGDVFSYSVPLSNSSSLYSTPEGNVSILNLSQREDGNINTPTNDVEWIKNSNVDNSTIFELVVASKDNKSSDGDSLSTLSELENEPKINSSRVVTNVTHFLLESVLPRSNSSGLISSKSRENVTSVFHESNRTSSIDSSSNMTNVLENLSNDALEKVSSEELSASESSEEILIYLKENNTVVIKTTSVKTQGQNWTYDGTHHMIHMDISDNMTKYFKDETPQTTPAPKKKTKVVTLRKKPQKGEGMKTKRRKVYKPQARTGLPFSPRGFNPGMTPRGSRPGAQQVFDEEDFNNNPVVIGVPRPDFSDYELYVPGEEPDHLEPENLEADEYEYVTYKDPYSSREDMNYLSLVETNKYLKFSGPNVRTYFIAAEETEWDYSGYGQRRQEKSQQYSRETAFTKVVFRGYTDSSFSTPEIRGEMNEHRGILGPVIKAEVGQTIMVVFRNNANRPYSIHPNGVSYAKQTEGLSYEDESTHWYKYDNEVQPNTTFTYLWKVNPAVGPKSHESRCRTWAYYSGVNPERDINSGLIGPLLVCREGTLDKNLTSSREFMLLFMTFDESQSWYYERNCELIRRKSRRRILDADFKENLKFHSINGIIYNLKGLRMYTDQLVRWHLINMGSPKDFQSVHFHGQTFLHKKTTSYRQAVFPLLPGSFATLEMYPSRPGLWQLETEIGFNQDKGMQTLFLVLDKDCYRPLGLQSGSVKDEQITAINTRGYWKPHLARLNNQGKYNAWSTEQGDSYIQVDFQRPVVISQVATQGAKQMFYSHYVTRYTISYSNDRRRWTFYKGDSRDLRKVFTGNQEAYETKTNMFFPPVVGRFIRLHPVEWYKMATVRMEFYGCELDGCSVPLGIESGFIEDHRITASSIASNWYSGTWQPSLARLNKQGTANAWQAKHNNMIQWLQVELSHVKKITGIITQGAKSLGKEMFVLSYTLQFSTDGIHWTQYTDDEDLPFKTFPGNKNNNDHMKNYIYPPIFSRFIRIIPISWMNAITMRIELLGCDFE